jgi:hypothetical protein
MPRFFDKLDKYIYCYTQYYFINHCLVYLITIHMNKQLNSIKLYNHYSNYSSALILFRMIVGPEWKTKFNPRQNCFCKAKELRSLLLSQILCLLCTKPKSGGHTALFSSCVGKTCKLLCTKSVCVRDYCVPCDVGNEERNGVNGVRRNSTFSCKHFQFDRWVGVLF